jgi:transcriptional regulator with XRE-family HTH domain
MALSFSGNRLFQLRTAAGMSREQLAVALGRSHSAVARWEAASLTPAADVLARLAEVFGVGIETLFDAGPPAVVPPHRRAAPRVPTSTRAVA